MYFQQGMLTLAKLDKARQYFIWGLVPAGYVDCFPNNLKLQSFVLSYLLHYT